MFKFLHAADLHLDSPLLGLQRYEGAPRDDIRQATRKALINLVNLALDERVRFVLLAGDLYDGDWKDYNTGLFFIKQMTRLHEANIFVYAVAGNHDAANRMTRLLRLPPNVKMFPVEAPATEIVPDLSVAIHGQSFATPAVTDDLSLAYPRARSGYFNIGLLHTCATGREGHERYAPCTVDGLKAKGYAYWALGHIHQQDILCEDPFVVFPGNLQGRHFREQGAKGCMLISVDDDGRASLKFRPVDVFRWESCTVDVTGADSEFAVVERILAEVRQIREHHALPLAVRIRVHGTTAAHALLLANRWRSTNEVCAQADEHTWIERIDWHTRALPGPLPTEGPIGELTAWLAQLRSSPSELVAVSQGMKDLHDLSRKLFQQTGQPLPFDDPSALREALDQVEPLLIRRLLSRGVTG